MSAKKKATTARAKTKTGKAKVAKPRGRPTRRTPAVIAAVLDGLAAGTPLTIICKSNKMPSTRTVYLWTEKDPEFSADFARAREAGFDQIAMDALAIADETENDTITIERGETETQIPNKEWILRSKLRVDTRLKLLAVWDPKRYGARIAQEISGPDGGPVRAEVAGRDGFRPGPETEEMVRRIAEARERVIREQADA